MQYLITARDGAGMPEKRMEVRPRHLENLAKVREKVTAEPMNVVIVNDEKVGR